MNVSAVSDAQLSLHDLLNQLESHPLPTIDLKLDRMVHFLELIGSPHHALPPMIHVAGTNGKGSVCAFLTALLQSAGKRVHRYTSPHLVHFRERIMLANQLADDALLAETLQLLLPRLEECPLTYFESTTALALQLFAQHPADYTMLEVGMGGRLDATNVIATPEITMITPIGMDHQAFLGNDIASIAAEKAAIMKPGVPSIVARQHPDALAVIETYADQVGAPLLREGYEWHVHIRDDGRWDLSGCSEHQGLPAPSLPGMHQYHNAAAALIAYEQLMHDASPAASAISDGLGQAYWPGRLQLLDAAFIEAHFAMHCPVYIDGGHNIASAEHIAAWITQQNAPVHLVVGMHRDKDATDVLALLSPHLASMHTLTIPDDPLSLQAEELASLAPSSDLPVVACSSLKDAMSAISQQQPSGSVTKEQKPTILIYGSLYLAGYVLGMVEAYAQT